MKHFSDPVRWQHRIETHENDPQGYGDGLSDVVKCRCGQSFGEVQEGGHHEAESHLLEVIDDLTVAADRIYTGEIGFNNPHHTDILALGVALGRRKENVNAR